MAQVFWQLGSSEDVLRTGQMAARTGGNDVGTLFARADAYYFSGLGEESIPLLRQIIAIDPANKEAQYALVRNSSIAGRFRETIQEGDVYFRKFGRNFGGHGWIARAYHGLNDLDNARIHYEEQDELSRSVGPGLGILLKQTGRPEDAMQTWRDGVQIRTRRLGAHPRNPNGRSNLAVFYACLGDEDALAREEARILREAPDNGYAIWNLGRAYAVLGDVDRAVELYRLGLSTGQTFYWWRHQLRAEGTEYLLESPAYIAFLEEYDETLDRLRALY